MLFKDAKVGDVVAIIGRRGAITKGIIAALTNTQVTVGGSKFTRSRGTEISGTINAWDKLDIRPWTAEIEASIASAAEASDRGKRNDAANEALRAAVYRMTNRRHNLTDDQILAVAALAAYVDATITAILGGDK
jgi:hypothetical protein